MRRVSVLSVGALLMVGFVAMAAGSASATHTPKPPVSTVKSIVPDHGSTAGGTIVKIKGKNLVTATAVDFGSTAASFEVDGSALVATAPADSSPETVQVTVTTSDGVTAVTSADQFTYELDSPTISNISPKSGPALGGTKVKISGSNLSGATVVDFGSTPSGTVTQDSANEITATAPAEAVGTVAISVTTGNGTTPPDPADLFTYKVDAPRVTSLSPENGTVGTQVTIGGSGFSKVTSVDFGGVSAPIFTINSGKSITATVPSGSGTVEVTVTDANGTSGPDDPFTQFTYVVSAS
jgi:hypothetical protein